MNKTRLALIIIAVIVAIYVFFVSPLDEKRVDLESQLESRYAALMKHKRFIKRTQDAGEELESAKKELDKMERYIIKATDTSLAFAALQTKIQDIAASAGLSIKSIKPLPVVEYKGYKGLPIFMDAMGDIRNLSKFLNFLDSTWEFISIDSMNVSTSVQDNLRIKIQLSGLMKS